MLSGLAVRAGGKTTGRPDFVFISDRSYGLSDWKCQDFERFLPEPAWSKNNRGLSPFLSSTEDKGIGPGILQVIG